ARPDAHRARQCGRPRRDGGAVGRRSVSRTGGAPAVPRRGGCRSRMLARRLQRADARRTDGPSRLSHRPRRDADVARGAWPSRESPVLPIGSMTSLTDTKRYEGVMANITGNPAMSGPLPWNADTLPIGMNFLAPFGDEATLFRLAGHLEAARPWDDRWPPVSI